VDIKEGREGIISNRFAAFGKLGWWYWWWWWWWWWWREHQ